MAYVHVLAHKLGARTVDTHTGAKPTTFEPAYARLARIPLAFLARKSSGTREQIKSTPLHSADTIERFSFVVRPSAAQCDADSRFRAKQSNGTVSVMTPKPIKVVDAEWQQLRRDANTLGNGWLVARLDRM